MRLVVNLNGTTRAIYGEEINLRSLGRLTIARASHVEPNGDGDWVVDLSPVRGPILGPFAMRTKALEAEHAWLEKHWLGEP
jgi:hypothetical protein